MKHYAWLLLCSLSLSCGNKNRKDVYTMASLKQHGQFLQACQLLYQGQEERSLNYFDSCFKEMPEKGPYTYFLYYQFRSTYFNKKEDVDNSLLYADSAIHVLEKNRLEHALYNEYLHALLEKGQALAAKERYREAYDLFLKAKQLARTDLDSCSQHEYSYRIAMTLYKEGKFRDAAYYFKDAYQKNMTCDGGWNTYSGAQELLSNTGLSYAHCDMNDSAIYYYRSALSFLKAHEQELPSKKNLEIANGVIYGNLGKVFLDAGNLDTAEDLLKRGLAINEQPGYDNRDAQLVRTSLARVYLNKKNLPAARNVLLVLQQQLDLLPNLEAARDMNFLFSEYYEAVGDGKAALPYYKAYITYRDSMQDVKAKRLRTDIMHEMDSKEQQYEIKLLKKDNQVSKLYLWIVAAFAVLSIAIVVLIYFNYTKSRRQKNALEKSNREKDRILNVVAHDLRSPVGGVAYLADMMLMEDGLTEQVTEAFGSIKAATGSSLQLINELLGFSQEQGNVQKERTDIGLLATETKQLLEYKAKEKELSLLLSLPGEPVFININREKISRVLTNIIVNAIKFSKNNSDINIAVTKHRNTVLLAVKDHGIGIPAALLPAIFELFTTSKRKGTGGERSYGLGLAICKQIVDAHNGRIWIESMEGAGSTFYVELPM